MFSQYNGHKGSFIIYRHTPLEENKGGEKNFDELLGGRNFFFASNPDLNHQVDIMAIIKSYYKERN